MTMPLRNDDAQRALDGYDWTKAFQCAGAPEGDDYPLGQPQVNPVPPPAIQVSPDGFQRKDVRLIWHIEEGENDGADWLVVGRLEDGRFFALRAGCDYLAGGSASVAASLEAIYRFGLDDRERERLGIEL